MPLRRAVLGAWALAAARAAMAAPAAPSAAPVAPLRAGMFDPAYPAPELGLRGSDGTERPAVLASLSRREAVVEVAGKRLALRLGESPASLGERGQASSGRISLPADSGGHFMASGSINGRPVQFMVDTGASSVALGVNDAERIGLPWRAGQTVRIGTANGVVQGWRIKLASVRIGDVEIYEVDAVVTPQALPFVLLGNSYLSRFQMRRDNDLMVLERRY